MVGVQRKIKEHRIHPKWHEIKSPTVRIMDRSTLGVHGGAQASYPNLLSYALLGFPVYWPLHSHPDILIPLDQWSSAQKYSILEHIPTFLLPSLGQSKFFLLQTPAQTSSSLWHFSPHHFSLVTVSTAWISHWMIRRAMKKFSALVAYQNHLWGFKKKCRSLGTAPERYWFSWSVMSPGFFKFSQVYLMLVQIQGPQSRGVLSCCLNI